MIRLVKPGLRNGVIAIPASKSDAQRAYLAAALAPGKSTITGWGNSRDEQAMLAAITKLGAAVSVTENEMIIEGIHNFPETALITAGESGLGIRLLSMICAAHKGVFSITGEGSLAERPMDFLETHLPLFGASCQTTNGKVPLEIRGAMHGASAKVDGSLSSQFISGLLMALPLVNGNSELEVQQLTSKPYIDMTLQTLEAFGIVIRTKTPSAYHVPGEQMYHATHYQIDADWSSASYWLVAAAIGHSVALRGLRLDSFQADKALMSFLQAANCQVLFKEDTISVDGSSRKAFNVDATDCPDLFPALAALAASCNGTSVISGAARLTHKESNRGLALQSEFGKLGVKIDLDLDEDVMRIHGTGAVNGGVVDSHNDHRIAMCLAIAATIASGPVEIHGAESVAKSYPDFWRDLEGLS
ncbi:MAG TPA: 3-phosphoshikimate 1-carboxyvinyltransferase [Fluviicola sp.]|nr:3-phosphoshikimate 1-carboxyvinyltransferase [Fluviicola sp.]